MPDTFISKPPFESTKSSNESAKKVGSRSLGLAVVGAAILSSLLLSRRSLMPNAGSVSSIVLGLTVQLLDCVFLTYLSYVAFLRPIRLRITRNYEESRVELGKEIGAIAEKDGGGTPQSEKEPVELWSELRDQVLGAIGPEAKFGWLKQLRDEAKWFSKREAKAVFDNPKTGNSLWLRLLKLFNESIEVYVAKKKSLLDAKDTETTTVDESTYEKNLRNLMTLCVLTRTTICEKLL